MQPANYLKGRDGCELCKYTGYVYRMATHTIGGNPLNREVPHRCNCHRMYCAQERFKLLKDKAGMDGYDNMSFDTYRAVHPSQRQALSIVREADKIKGFYLHGKVGRGKTHLMAATVKQAIKKGVPSLILSMPALMRELNTIPFDERASLESAIKKVPYLVMDDIGKERITDNNKEILFTILDYRWRGSQDKRSATSFTSQLSLEGLATKGYDEASISRIEGMVTVMKIDGENRR